MIAFRPAPQVALLSLIVAVGACRFTPEVASGVQACGAGGACPEGLSCRATGRCCSSDDRSPACTGAARVSGDVDAKPAETAHPAPTSDGAGPIDADADADAAPSGAVGDAGSNPGDPTPTVPTVTRVTTTSASLTSLIDNCSKAPRRNGVPPDRWCAFAHDDELWVVNITRAVRQTVRCDGSDPLCLRLTSKLHREKLDPSAYVNPIFWGDLLIFSAEAIETTVNAYRGGVFAWLPGWSAPRRLTSSKGVKCRAANSDDKAWGQGVWCVDNPGSNGEVDILVAPSPTAPMTLVTRRPYAPGRLAALTDDAQTFVYLTERPGRSELYLTSVANAGDATKHLRLSDDVVLWQIGAGADAAVYFLRPDGRLSVVNVATPTAPVDLALRITSFEVMLADNNSDNGIWALQDERAEQGTLQIFFDRTPSRKIDGGKVPVGGFDVASDRRFTMLPTEWNAQSQLSNVTILNNVTKARCVLQPKVTALIGLTGSFSPDSSWTSWYQDQGGVVGDLWIGKPDGCAELHLLGHATDTMYMFDTRGILFLDEFAPETGGRLQYLAWGPNETWSGKPPVTLLSQVDDYDKPQAAESLIPFTSKAPGQEGFYVAEIPPP